jgi:hypothetical protein
MANISYGRSISRVIGGNAKTRRHMSRMLKAIKHRESEEKLSVKPEIKSNVLVTKEVIQTLYLGLSPSAKRVAKAIFVQKTQVYDTFDNCCLPHVAIFSVHSKKKKS